MEFSKGKRILIFSSFAIVGTYFLFLGLIKASGFLAPLLTAIILALILLPLSQKMERKGVKRGISSFLSVLFLFLLSLGFTALISFQVRNFVSDWSKIKNTMQPKIEQFKSFVFEHSPLEKSDLSGSGSNNKKPSSSTSKPSGENLLKPGFPVASSSDLSTSSKNLGLEIGSSFVDSGSAAKKALNFFQKTLNFMGSFMLSFIYMFFLLNYRQRFKEFFLRLFPQERKGDIDNVLNTSAKVSQQYLVGKLILMGFLAVLYAIGLGISGVSNFVMVSIIAALLTLIPYIGNVIGMAMAVAFGFLTSGEVGVLIGIIITFTVTQFVESYILQPYVLGDKVNLHPFFVLIGVVAGGLILGIVGMILAVPILAILSIIFLHVGPLNPFGFLLSQEDPGKPH